jgi:hypothetical protein
MENLMAETGKNNVYKIASSKKTILFPFRLFRRDFGHREDRPIFYIVSTMEYPGAKKYNSNESAT